MNVDASVTINAPVDAVWSVATDIEGSQRTISGIEEVEILERPSPGIRGLKWKETRTIAGKKAVETMWITDVEEKSYYVTEARSHGSIYRTRVSVSESGGRTTLSMAFTAEPVSTLAKVFSTLLGPLMKRSIKKAFQKDLEDLKAAAESRAARPSGAMQTESV